MLPGRISLIPRGMKWTDFCEGSRLKENWRETKNKFATAAHRFHLILLIWLLYRSLYHIIQPFTSHHVLILLPIRGGAFMSSPMASPIWLPPCPSLSNCEPVRKSSFFFVKMNENWSVCLPAPFHHFRRNEQKSHKELSIFSVSRKRISGKTFQRFHFFHTYSDLFRYHTMMMLLRRKVEFFTSCVPPQPSGQAEQRTTNATWSKLNLILTNRPSQSRYRVLAVTVAKSTWHQNWQQSGEAMLKRGTKYSYISN